MYLLPKNIPMKRRTFLRTAATTTAAMPIMLNGMPLHTLPKTAWLNSVSNDTDRVLVLIQMNGGNDGLNMVLPIDQYDNLANARSNILIPEEDALKIDETIGLHPNLWDVKDMYDEGMVKVVQSVGYPNQNRSHFRSMDIWSQGSPPDEFWSSGWMGRYFDRDHNGYPVNYPNEEFPDPFAISMGNIAVETCEGVGTNYSMAIWDPFSVGELYEGAADELPETPYGGELAFLRNAIRTNNDYSEVIEAAAEMGFASENYPGNNRLAEQLRNVSLLISGGLRTKVYVVSIGGFDTHAEQVEEGSPIKGAHGALLWNINQAVDAFMKDLKEQGLAERVLCMTFSEFGRQIRSNDSFGTDHGTAAPLMLFGSCVEPGILGDNPQIPVQVDRGEGVAMQIDFRDVYGSILLDWFEVPEEEVRTMLYEDFTYLPILRPCGEPPQAPGLAGTIIERDDALMNFPNPFHNSTEIRFESYGEHIHLSIFDNVGREMQVLVNGFLPKGQHRVAFSAANLPPGNYYYRLRGESGRMKTKMMVKM